MTHQLKCDICGEMAKPAGTAQRAAINLGHHKRSKHGVAGKGNARYAKPKRKNKPRKHKSESPEAQPCKLDHCPGCGARFYFVGGER